MFKIHPTFYLTSIRAKEHRFSYEISI